MGQKVLSLGLPERTMQWNFPSSLLVKHASPNPIVSMPTLYLLGLWLHLIIVSHVINMS